MTKIILAHSELTNRIYALIGKEKIDITEQAIAEVKAIKALEQDPILDKIRAEIDEQYDRVYPYDISCAEGLEMALEIIDNYKAESED